MISDVTVQKVKDLSAVEVIGNYVNLKKKGANYICLCPFHGDKSPSMSVSPSKNIWKCFSCGESGDAIAFVQKFKNLEFDETIIDIAEHCGINVEYSKSEMNEKQLAEAKHRETLLASLKLVQDYFVECINTDSEKTASGREYAFNQIGRAHV